MFPARGYPTPLTLTGSDAGPALAIGLLVSLSGALLLVARRTVRPDR